MRTFERARAFIYRNARPLDLARFQYHFENGSREAVLRALSAYQNADGGFGHAVEADCWNPNSTPLHSNTASDILREIDFDGAQHPLVKGLVGWYASGAHFNGKTWNITVESNNDYPHAPWWHTESVSKCHADYNGSAQIAGFLLRYAKEGSEPFRLGARVANEAIAALDADSLNDQHTCLCYLRMLQLAQRGGALENIAHEELSAKLHTAVQRLIERDETKWSAYVCTPSVFIDSPKSVFYAGNEEICAAECRFLIDSQLPDGSWNIGWSWQDFPEEWAISKNWWKGHLIVQNLLFLRGFGKI